MIVAVLDVNVVISAVLAALGFPRQGVYAQRAGRFVAAPEGAVVTGDPVEDLVLATCRLAHADYLVTGDRGLLELGSYAGTAIVTPRECIIGRL